MPMFEKLEGVEAHYDDLKAQLTDPEVVSSHERWTRLNREAAQLEVVVLPYRAWRDAARRIEENKLLLRDDDAEIRELARLELDELQEALPRLEQELKLAMLPRDERDDRDVILEIRAGAGGDESSLFAGDLLEMYTRYCAARGWKLEILSESPGTMGGYKEVTAAIGGDRVYSSLKFESGVHRVQRVPATEAQGRIHTSTCTVAILAEAEDVEVKIDPKDLRIDTYRASGAGGQHVNRTDSAVRITHLPTNTVVQCQSERSQIQNRERAMKMLRSRMLEVERERADAARASERRDQVGTGDRSERIRTYNFPQNRVTDHRIDLTLYQLDRVMLGELQPFVDALTASHQAELLKRAEAGY